MRLGAQAALTTLAAWLTRRNGPLLVPEATLSRTRPHLFGVRTARPNLRDMSTERALSSVLLRPLIGDRHTAESSDPQEAAHDRR
jgi:hypothetical protein